MDNKKPDQSYTIEQLVTLFSTHVEEYAAQCKERPEICVDSFNLPLALKTICNEILKYKEASNSIKS